MHYNSVVNNSIEFYNHLICHPQMLALLGDRLNASKLSRKALIMLQKIVFL